ncbi:MAG: hypothetical protein RLZZ361_1035 [Cyanobacteriota bacterium]|jgi:trigger factor
MEITISDRDQENKITLSFQTEKGKAKEAYLKTVKNISKDLTIKGFRKGKAPLRVVEDYYGKENIRAQTLDNKFLSKLFEEVFQLQGLKVMQIASVEKVEFNDPDESISIEAIVELFPEITLPDFKSMSIDVKIPKFDIDDQVQKTIEQYLLEAVTYEESNEAIEMDDIVVFDFDGRFLQEDGNWISKSGMKAESYQCVIKSKKFIDNFLEQLVGMKAGEEKEIDVTFPADYHDAELANRPAKFLIKIHKVSKSCKPTLDDSFVQSIGYDSVEDLKQKAIEVITTYNQNNIRSITGETILNKLIEEIPINLSASIVEKEYLSDLKNYQTAHNLSDEELEDIKNNLDMNLELKSAGNKIKRSIIITTIVNAQGFEASEEEIQTAFQNLDLPANFQLPKANLPAIVSRLNLEVVSKKAVDYLVDSININYQEVPKEEYHAQDGHVHGPHCNHS